jgi:hypothetical protein
MSVAALAMATRDLLRAQLTDFYDTPDSEKEARRKTNCRVMPDERPAPNCGQEFIAINARSHQPIQTGATVAIEEKIGFVIAVTRKVADVPQDARGEAAWIIDDDQYLVSWKSIEERCREIAGLIDKNYQLLRNADALFEADNGFSEPLFWTGTDPMPQQVGESHFSSYPSGLPDPMLGIPAPEADPVSGLVMRVYFDGAVRFQDSAAYDRHEE